MLLHLRFLSLHSSPAIFMRFLLFALARSPCALSVHFRHMPKECLKNSDRGLIVLHARQLILSDKPSATAFNSSDLAWVSGGLCRSLNFRLVSLAFSLFLGPLLYSLTQVRHQLPNPDLTLLFGGKADNSFTTLHFEHDLFMRRIVPSRLHL